ncbi:MAG: tRNA (N6-isopentenyl adenosine(37)-C2)-methylthiotransferase MiaB [Candidatus Nealsonbacteria bacterium RBG_13_36_15]|uniref:tRNA-2-methylthio-N(6)-dimethylallyladenosine synthase n=1 Tax=Candidatus Nealsonbacteria bacterium RBG_13_36_15 TaxID=1801660 RepID=A0A1G2DW32_9BACT|nr:MAG: tRNA (N6-isopentenyl adenosine(37)-C2)-methylthiotransferase MiaB [Candidatus Nealsonbacteria bacterium RBG_13_36_15]
MKKYWIITFGCQMNRSDSERIAAVLEDSGYQPSVNLPEADLILVNACSVRQSAIDRIHGLTPKFKELKAKNHKLKTVLTGCVLKKDKKKISEKFDLILDINDLPELPNFLQASDYKPKNKNYLKIQPKYSTDFTAFIPIMTGCNNFCTFCVVPYTRGHETSRKTQEILCEVENLAKRGYKEIWLLGQNVNSYKFGEINFPKLLKEVNNVKGNFWIRFTSSHPKDFSEELIDVMASCKKVTEYLNLPVQSGDNGILKKMNRPYTTKRYKKIIRKIRERIPNITLSTDAIVGFPGETERQFQNTAELFKEIKFDMAYIAQYSPRAGTKAANLKDNISHQEKERRWKVLSDILKKTALEKNKQWLGKAVEVLASEQKNDFLIGKTREFKTTKFKGSENLVGNFVKIKVAVTLPWGLKGEII